MRSSFYAEIPSDEEGRHQQSERQSEGERDNNDNDDSPWKPALSFQAGRLSKRRKRSDASPTANDFLTPNDNQLPSNYDTLTTTATGQDYFFLPPYDPYAPFYPSETLLAEEKEESLAESKTLQEPLYSSPAQPKLAETTRPCPDRSHHRLVPAYSLTSSCSSSGDRSSAPAQKKATLYREALENLPIYPYGAAAPSRLPAHRPVRLRQPKHPLAPPCTPVYFKYGEEHYPEETVPDQYTFQEPDGTACRYITNFLVYNKRGERLLPIEMLDQPRHSSLVLYGSLLSVTATPIEKSDAGVERRKSRRKHLESGKFAYPLYPIRAELAEWCVDYGQEPRNVPCMWLISSLEIFYRLERPAGRYISTFASAKTKFELSTRIIKTLQWNPETNYTDLIEWLTAASRQEKRRKREEQKVVRGTTPSSAQPWSANSNFDGGESGGNPPEQDTTESKRKATRVHWKSYNSLSTPEGTGVLANLANGQAVPLTPWGAPYAVHALRESTILSLTDFIESQIRNFLDGMGGSQCPNILDTPFMHTLREKASIRRETLHLVEAKRRSIDSMAVVGAFENSALPSERHNFASLPPPLELRVVRSMPLTPQALESLAGSAPGLVAQGVEITSAAVSIGFPPEATNLATSHRDLVLLRTRQQEELELKQLLNLLREFSDPEDEPPATTEAAKIIFDGNVSSPLS